MDDEKETKGESSWKVVAQSLKDIFLDMGGWGVGDVVIGLRYLSKAKARAREEAGTRVPEGNITDKAFIQELRHYAELISGTYSKDEEELLKRTMLKRGDLIRAEWKSAVSRPAYYIAHDTDINAIILGIRGTASIKDALTDCVATVDPFMDGVGHRGMVRAALWFEANLKEELKGICEERGLPLRVVGHSLGGGTSAMLTMLFRDDFPGIHAYTLAPPASLCIDLCPKSLDIVTSMILEDDVIPRFSTVAVEDLRLEVVNYPWATEFKDDVKGTKIVRLANDTKNMIGERAKAAKLDEKMAKMKLKASDTYKSLDTKYRVTERASKVSRMVTKSGKVAVSAVKSAGSKVVSVFRRKPKAGAADDDAEEEEEEVEVSEAEIEDQDIAAAIKLYPPGHVYHITRHDGRHYIAEEPNSNFGEILLSDTYLSDHLMASYVAGIRDVEKYL